jgi:pyruvate/2-oxoglutarate dehydrogenase complex dihydrolipoamide dehydrogenase (E3) component
VNDNPELLPRDEHNQTLVDNVHPADWQNPRPSGRYNLVVLGGGTAGLVAAAIGGAIGARTALVEKNLLGGDCLNMGCIPSKTLLRSARMAAAVKVAGDFGIRVPAGVTVDFAAVMERVRRTRAAISPHDSAARLRDEFGVDVFIGAGRFSGPETLAVGGETLTFKRALIATGSSPALPPIDGLEEAGFQTNETVFNLTALPQRLAVLGAGPQGCELAQAFRRLGSEVYLLDQESRVMTHDDPDAAAVVEKQLVRDGVRLMTGSGIVRVAREGAERIIEAEYGGRTEIIVVDDLIVATGRRPAVSGLDLEQAGVEYNEATGIAVDDHLATTNDRIYAAGDVCLEEKFTHTAAASARIAVQNALLSRRGKKSAMVIPWCTYTDPEVAHVGLSSESVAEKSGEINTITISLEEIDRAIIDGQTGGFARIHFTGRSSRIVGATIVAPGAGEIITGISIAMAGDVRLKDLVKVIYPYPTMAGAIRMAALEYQRGRMNTALKKALSGFFFLRRKRS